MMYQKWKEFMNRNIVRKLTVLLIPAICGIFILSFLAVSYMYSRDLIESIEAQTQYSVETARIHMDYCVEGIKNSLNNLSGNPSIREIVSMDLDHINYKEYLRHERNLKQAANSCVYADKNLQDLVIVGNNGYQYEFLSSFYTDITETEWFAGYVDSEKKGFQYILPHDLNYYAKGKRPMYDQAASILLPIKEAGEILGYAIADIGIGRLIDMPEMADGPGNIKTYIVNREMDFYYDVVAGTSHICGEETFLSVLGDKRSDFVTVGNEFIAYSRMQSNGWYIVSVYEHDDIIRSVRNMQKIGGVMVCVSCLLIFFVSHLMSRYINRPVQELLERIQAVEMQDFRNVESDYKNQPEEIVLIRKRFEEMVQQIDGLVNKVYLNEIYRKEMEYEQLVNQINPHFLYNVLQLIQSKAVLSENYEINDIVVALSKLLRYAMNNQEKVVTVAEECDYVSNYLLLYQQRYTGKFMYNIQIEKGAEQCRIIKFAIQPIVENCIKHGLRRQGGGNIRICIGRQEDILHICVCDNGNGIPPERLEELNWYIREASVEEESIGLRNVYQRLKLMYDGKAGMKIESEEGRCTRVDIRIPAEECGEERERNV